MNAQDKSKPSPTENDSDSRPVLNRPSPFLIRPRVIYRCPRIASPSRGRNSHPSFFSGLGHNFGGENSPRRVGDLRTSAKLGSNLPELAQANEGRVRVEEFSTQGDLLNIESGQAGTLQRPNNASLLSESGGLGLSPRNFLFKKMESDGSGNGAHFERHSAELGRSKAEFANSKSLKHKLGFVNTFTLNHLQIPSWKNQEGVFNEPRRVTSLGNSAKTKQIKKRVQNQKPANMRHSCEEPEEPLNPKNQFAYARELTNQPKPEERVPENQSQRNEPFSSFISVKREPQNEEGSLKTESYAIYSDQNKQMRFIRLGTKEDFPEGNLRIQPLEDYLKSQIQTLGNLPFDLIISRLDSVKRIVTSILNVNSNLNVLEFFKNFDNENKIKTGKREPEANLQENFPPENSRSGETEKPVQKRKKQNSKQTKTRKLETHPIAKSSRKAKIISISKPPQKLTITRKSDSDQKCHCDRTKCLRLHCVCFKNTRFCSSDCGCKECFNVEANREFVEQISRTTQDINPYAFESKLIQAEVRGEQMRLTKGCNCSKNQCKKRYCECRKAGVVCSTLCRCADCKNGKIEIGAELVKRFSKKKSRKKKKINLSGLKPKNVK